MEPNGTMMQLKVRLRPGPTATSRYPLMSNLAVWDEATGNMVPLDRIAIIGDLNAQDRCRGLIMVEMRVLCALDIQTEPVEG